MHEVLVNGLGGLSLPTKSVVRLNDHPDTTLDVYRGRKTTTQQQLRKFKVLFAYDAVTIPQPVPVQRNEFCVKILISKKFKLGDD